MNSLARILLTVADISPASGGPARSVPGLARALAGAGARVELLTLASIHGETARPEVFTTFVRSPISPFRDLRAMGPWRSQLSERCAVGAIELVHDAGVWLPVNHVTASVTRRLRLPRVVSPRGMLEQWALGHRSGKKSLAWKLYQQRDLEGAALLHATSAQEAESIRRAGLRNPIGLVPNGVDLPETTTDCLSSSPRRALFLSRIHPKKGLLDLVQAWATVRPSNWKMIVAGPDEGGHLAEVRGAVRAAGLDAEFEFTGSVNDGAKWVLYQDAEFFVLPSYSENFGLVIAEALASGLPVITTQATPWREIETEQLGWWIPPGGEALAGALREATACAPGVLAAMGARGRRVAAERYSWSAAAGKMLAIYLWLLGRGERPAWVEVD